MAISAKISMWTYTTKAAASCEKIHSSIREVSEMGQFSAGYAIKRGQKDNNNAQKTYEKGRWTIANWVVVKVIR